MSLTLMIGLGVAVAALVLFVAVIAAYPKDNSF